MATRAALRPAARAHPPWLVPVAIALSLVPDIVLAVTRFIPGADTTAAVALGTMHLIVAGVAVPLFQRIAPVR